MYVVSFGEHRAPHLIVLAPTCGAREVLYICLIGLSLINAL